VPATRKVPGSRAERWVQHHFGGVGSSGPKAGRRIVETARAVIPTSVVEGRTGEGNHLRRKPIGLRTERSAKQGGIPVGSSCQRSPLRWAAEEARLGRRLEWRQARTSRSFGITPYGVARNGKEVDQPVLPRRDDFGHRTGSGQEPEERESFGTNETGRSERCPATPGINARTLRQERIEHLSDLGQQREPKPKGGSGRSRLRRRKPATDSNAEQGLEVEGDDGNLGARQCEMEPSGEIERRPGGQGEDILLNDEKARAGASRGEVEESFRGHTEPGTGGPQRRLRARENLRRVTTPRGRPGDRAAPQGRIFGSEQVETGGSRQPLRRGRKGASSDATT